jgi:hypothetical protein
MSDLLKAFTKNFEDTYHGALICSMSSKRWAPGLLLNVRWWSVFRSTEIVSVEGHVADLGVLDAELNKDRWPLVQDVAQLMESAFIGKASLTVEDAQIPQLGLEFDADFAKNTTLSVEVGTVTTKSFEDSFAHRKIRNLLVGLRKSHPDLYRLVHGDMLIYQCHYITEFKATAKNSGHITLKAGVEAGTVKLKPGMTYKWENDNTITVGGSPEAPVAVSGCRIDYSRPDYRG